MIIEESPYYLSRHAFFCLADNHYVFLDLRRDEYLCLGRTHTDAVRGLLSDRCLIDEPSAGSQLQDTGNSDVGAVVRALLQRELLVQDVADGKPLAPPRLDTPWASTMKSIDKPRPAISAAHIWNFFAASAIASKDLRCQSIERTVRKVEVRKAAHATDTTLVDSDAITDLFRVFQALRPYYPRPYLCMFDSLALVHFLARYGVFPQWVYGVRLEPFNAHCWVQEGNRVVNDIIDNVRNYTPIMSV